MDHEWLHANDARVQTSWIEWAACFVAAAVAVISLRHGKWWLMLGLAVITAGWLLGTAKGLLLPVALGSLALWPTLRTGKYIKSASLMLALGGAAASAFLCWLFPVPESPVLSGSYAVGTLTFELAQDGKKQGLIAQVWFPAKEGENVKRSKWLPDPELAPHFPYHRMRDALSRSCIGMTLSAAAKRYPVLFYEHSWTGHRAENVAQVEDLASRGFVVIAVDHPGQAARTKYKDGSVILGKLPASLDFSTDIAVLDFEKLAEKCLLERRDDLARIKNTLAQGVVPMFAGRLELEKTGVFGFSFGGTCALRLCAVDSSFYAGANEDGFFLGEQDPLGAFLFFDEEMPPWMLKDVQSNEGPGEVLTRRSESRILKAMKQPERFRIILQGTRHESFSDLIFACRIPRLAHAGTRPASDVHQIVTTQLAEFFTRELGVMSLNNQR